MPSMGIGTLGAPETIIKRKFRFQFWISQAGGYAADKVPASFVKVAARPKLDFEETELAFLNEFNWIPGRGKWQPITVTYIDSNYAAMMGLMQWVLDLYDFEKYPDLPQTERKGWRSDGHLELYDGCGTLMESWIFRDIWPQSIDWGDLEYASSDEATIQVTYRYNGMEFTPGCGVNKPIGSCKGCND